MQKFMLPIVRKLYIRRSGELFLKITGNRGKEKSRSECAPGGRATLTVPAKPLPVKELKTEASF
jgi:hypothetical protein